MNIIEHCQKKIWPSVKAARLHITSKYVSGLVIDNNLLEIKEITENCKGLEELYFVPNKPTVPSSYEHFNEKTSILAAAIYSVKKEVVSMFIVYGLEPNLEDLDQAKAKKLAQQNKHNDLMLLLKNSGAEIDQFMWNRNIT